MSSTAFVCFREALGDASPHMRVDPTTRKISGGPLGWTCYGGGNEKRATLGSCANHTGAKRFYWDVTFGVK